MSQKLFDLAYVEAELRKADPLLGRDVSLCVIGGGAMAFHGIKAGTKDIDVILQTEDDADALAVALEEAAYAAPGELTAPYREMGARRVLENADGFRWDIFVRNVMGFRFFPRMARRAVPWLRLTRVATGVLSLEDIFTFKALTTRDRDRDDMHTLFLQGLDLDAIHDEVRGQAAEGTLDGKSFPAAFRQGVVELVEAYGLVYDVPADIEDLAFHAYLLQAIQDRVALRPVTLEEVAERYGAHVDEVERATRALAEAGRVRLEGRVIRPA